MKIEIDTDAYTIQIREAGNNRQLELYSDAGFEEISQLWKKIGWNQRYSYTFTWLGRPMIQLPEDAMRIQELIWSLRPDVIIETGVAHGGSLIYYASLLEILGSGRVIGVDIEIRPANRQAIEEHPLAHRIDLVVGDSAAEETIAQVRQKIKEQTILVILDSNHSKAHVARELEAYKSIVSTGSYIVVTDGVMIELGDVPNGKANWNTDNPVKAVEAFLAENSNFVLDPPKWLFNESTLTKPITYWPSAWLKRLH